MTLLVYGKRGNTELFVCGSPSREWLEWVRTTTSTLTSGQVMWRDIAQDRVDSLGLRVEPAPPLSEQEAESPQVGRLSALPDNLGLPQDPPPAPLLGPTRRKTRTCPHRDICDQCGRCERCDCYDCPL